MGTVLKSNPMSNNDYLFLFNTKGINEVIMYCVGKINTNNA